MSLENVLLGMLHRPASGYDLKRDFATGVRYFWSATLSQLYPTLQRMERRGLLKSRRLPPEKGPPRRVYERTAAGKLQLLRWLMRGPQLDTQRLAYVGQLRFLHETNDLAKTLVFVNQLREKLADVHLYLAEVQASVCPPGGDPARLPPEDLHAWLALGLGTAAMQARIEWCERAVEVLGQSLQPAAKPRRQKGTR